MNYIFGRIPNKLPRGSPLLAPGQAPPGALRASPQKQQPRSADQAPAAFTGQAPFDGQASQTWQELLDDAAEAFVRAQGAPALPSRELASAPFVAKAAAAVGRALDFRVPLGLEPPRNPPTPKKPLTRALSRTLQVSPVKMAAGPVSTSELGGERARPLSPLRKRPPMLAQDEVAEASGKGREPSPSVVGKDEDAYVHVDEEEGFDTPGESGEEAQMGKRKKRKRGKRVGR